MRGLLRLVPVVVTMLLRRCHTSIRNGGRVLYGHVCCLNRWNVCSRRRVAVMMPKILYGRRRLLPVELKTGLTLGDRSSWSEVVRYRGPSRSLTAPVVSSRVTLSYTLFAASIYTRLPTLLCKS